MGRFSGGFRELSHSQQGFAALGISLYLLVGRTVLVAFVALAALHESWTIPLFALTTMPNDVHFKVGMITVVGQTAKNANLIEPYARDLAALGVRLRAGGDRRGHRTIQVDRDDVDGVPARVAVPLVLVSGWMVPMQTEILYLT